MPRPFAISRLARDYVISVKSFEATRCKVENLLTRGELDIADVEQVYAGLFLSAFTEFEALIEDVFLGILSGTHASTISKRRVKIIPASLTREILFEGKQYLDWMPLEKHTHKRAKRFLNNGEPFSGLSDVEEKNLERLHLLRNAVAHKSDNAKVKFEASVQHLSLLPQEKTPTGFLRSKPQGSSGLNQYQIAVSELESVARKLCA
jgi:hypothetical protein